MRGRELPLLALPLSPLEGFIWAAGIEDTFITAPHPRTGRTLDEYELTEHYSRWKEDLALLADLGVSAARYGIPWHRVCPRPGEYDWSWSDQVLDTLVNTHRIEPIIDLVHYGTPLWLDDAFLNPNYPNYVADYAGAFAEHYRGLCYWYTPLNEPRINAWYAGRIGWWPPYRRSWNGFVQVLLSICRGICLTQQAIQDVDPRAILVHVDATDYYEAADPNDARLAAERDIRQDIVFLALDLVTGRVAAGHPLADWLLDRKVSESDLEWFLSHAVKPDAIGVNMYPMFSRKVAQWTSHGQVRVQIHACWAETLGRLLQMYADRYQPIPILVGETASDGSMKRRKAWIDDSIAAVAQTVEEGLAVIGYTFWPLYSLVTWAYRQGTRDPSEYLLDMGLWDLRPGQGGLERVRTPVVDLYKKHVQSEFIHSMDTYQAARRQRVRPDAADEARASHR